MIELEKLDFEGNVLFSKEYNKKQANDLLRTYGVYPQTNVVMWREKKVESKKRKNEDDKSSK